MKFHTFSGETPAEAHKKAQLECGENALVISTKQLRKKTISTAALYEVVVAIEEEEKKEKAIKLKENLHVKNGLSYDECIFKKMDINELTEQYNLLKV